MARRGMNVKVLGAAAVLVALGALTFLWMQGSVSPGVNQAESSYTVNCPAEITGICENVSQRYDANVSIDRITEYTSVNGSVYYLQVDSSRTINETGTSSAVLIYDAYDEQFNGFE